MSDPRNVGHDEGDYEAVLDQPNDEVSGGGDCVRMFPSSDFCSRQGPQNIRFFRKFAHLQEADDKTDELADLQKVHDDARDGLLRLD